MDNVYRLLKPPQPNSPQLKTEPEPWNLDKTISLYKCGECQTNLWEQQSASKKIQNKFKCLPIGGSVWTLLPTCRSGRQRFDFVIIIQKQIIISHNDYKNLKSYHHD